MAAALAALVGRARKTVAAQVLEKFIHDGAANWAIVIAWNGLLSVFPLVLAIAGLLGLILGTQASASIHSAALNLFPGGAQKDVLSALQAFEEQKGILALAGFVGLLWSGSALFGAMERAFAAVSLAPPRAFLQQRAMAFSMIFLFAGIALVAVGSSLLLLPALPHLLRVPPQLHTGLAAAGLQALIGIAAGMVLFTTVYYVVPRQRLAMVKVMPGAVVAGVLFEAITLLFPLYARIDPGVASYGKTFGLLFLLMAYFYLLGLIIMLGAEVNAVLSPARGGGNRPPAASTREPPRGR